MELVFYFIYVSLLLVKIIYGENNICDVFKNGTCIHTIRVSIPSDLKTVTVSYVDLSGKNETLAVCDWIIDHFSCDTKKGITYNAVSRTEISFSVQSAVPCLNGKFTLGSNGHGEFLCVEKSHQSEPKQRESESNTDNKEQNMIVYQDTVSEVKDNTIVAGVVGAVIGCLVMLLLSGICCLVWIKICRKPKPGPGTNNPTPDSEEKTPPEKTEFLTESEKNDHKNGTCVKQWSIEPQLHHTLGSGSGRPFPVVPMSCQLPPPCCGPISSTSVWISEPCTSCVFQTRPCLVKLSASFHKVSLIQPHFSFLMS